MGPGQKTSYQSTDSERHSANQCLSTPEGRFARYEHNWTLARLVVEPIKRSDWCERADQDLRPERNQQSNKRYEPG